MNLDNSVDLTMISDSDTKYVKESGFTCLVYVRHHLKLIVKSAPKIPHFRKGENLCMATHRELILTFASCFLASITMNSDLSSLSTSVSVNSHLRISVMHTFIAAKESAVCSGSGLKAM